MASDVLYLITDVSRVAAAMRWDCLATSLPTRRSYPVAAIGVALTRQPRGRARLFPARALVPTCARLQRRVPRARSDARPNLSPASGSAMRAGSGGNRRTASSLNIDRNQAVRAQTGRWKRRASEAGNGRHHRRISRDRRRPRTGLGGVLLGGPRCGAGGARPIRQRSVCGMRRKGWSR